MASIEYVRKSKTYRVRFRYPAPRGAKVMLQTKHDLRSTGEAEHDAGEV